MALITTPGQLKDQGEFYHQLASMVKSGVTIVQAVDILRRNAPNRRLKRVAEVVMESLVRGSTFTEALRATGQHLPEFDIALIEAGEASGRLEQCFRLLGQFYDDRGRLASRVLSELMYPIFLFHFAILIFPTGDLTALIFGDAMAVLWRKFWTLLPVYAGVGFALWSLQPQRSARWRAFVEGVFISIPLIGKTQRDIAMARLAAALEALINAGVLIVEAWDLAARASGSPRIIRAVAEARPRILKGELPSEAIQNQSNVYPDLFLSSYRTGEVSGQLDDSLRRIYQYYMEAATEGLHRIATMAPKLIYIGVAVGIAHQIISFYSGYFNQLNQIMGP